MQHKLLNLKIISMFKSHDFEETTWRSGMWVQKNWNKIRPRYVHTPGIIEHFVLYPGYFNWELSGSGAPGSWNLLHPNVSGFLANCHLGVEFSAYVRENEIFPSGQNSSTQATIQVTAKLVGDPDNTNPGCNYNCQQILPLTLSESEKGLLFWCEECILGVSWWRYDEILGYPFLW